jgi:hypothetical protein
MIQINVVFGNEAVQKILNNAPLNPSELAQFQKTYHFETRIEIEAFIKGINEAVGWQEVYVLEEILEQVSESATSKQI